MITPAQALASLPEGLRRALIEEFNEIINNFMECRWRPTELSAGRFCEVVYVIVNGYGKGTYPATPSKPRNFVEACRRLESVSGLPRSFQILIPRLLPALYEIRNNRNVGHVGGDVNPDHMDSSAVVSMASWIMAELIRVMHDISTEDAQKLVDNLIERRIPLIWKSGDIRRVLKPGLLLKDQILILLSSCTSRTSADDILSWTDYKNRSHFNRILRSLHAKRFLEYHKEDKEVEILPPGADYVSKLLRELK